MTNLESPYIGQQQIALVVDPYSTGCLVAQEIQKRGYLLVAIWTIGFSAEMKTHVPAACGRMDYFGEIEEAETLEETKARIEEIAQGHKIL